MKCYYDIAELGDNVFDLVGHLANIGVELRADGSQLTYRAPKGVLSEEDVAALRAFRDQIVALLGGHCGGDAEAAAQLEAGVQLAPLSFSQLSHWNVYRLWERPSHTVPGIATRWRGKLDLDALRRTLGALVQRHGALRTRIVLRGRTPMQEVREAISHELVVDDLTKMEDHLRDAEVRRLIYKYTFDSIDVKSYPLFRFRLIKIQEEDHVLIMVMEHIITDGVSINILQTDLFSLYQDLSAGKTSSLPSVSMQFADYARSQRRAVQSWIGHHYPYWKQRLKGCRRVRFPGDRNDKGRRGLEALPFRIGADLHNEARAWCRSARTTPVMCFFVAFVALVLRWCDVPESVILFQSDGRTGSAENTFGYLASPLYLRMALFDSDNYNDLLIRVIEEYCNAREHADASLLEAQLPLPGFSRNGRFNWLRQGPEESRLELHGSQGAIDVSRWKFEDPGAPNFERDVEPQLGFVETSEDVLGFVIFRVDRFSVNLMERFSRNYVRFVEVLLRFPETNLKSIVLE